MKTSSRLQAAAGILLDLIILSELVSILAILSGHLGAITIGPVQVRLTTLRSPTAIALAAAILRTLAIDVPVLGLRRLSLRPFAGWCLVWCRRGQLGLAEIKSADAIRILMVVSAVSIAIKTANVLFHFGFWTGDDVEIHEMTFARVFGWDWTAWNLRSPFYPMTFLFPIQELLHLLGYDDPAVLIAAARFVVMAFSIANLWLVFIVARKVFASVPVALLSALILAADRLHVIGGSTELPRTVSSFFVLLSFFLLLRVRPAPAAIAGVAMALGAVLRFSEVVFVAPAILQLASRKRWRDLGLFAAGFAALALLVLGPLDQMYWGTPFFSVSHFADFTLVQRLSSRGVQPFWEYGLRLLDWTDPLVAVAALSAIRLRLWTLVGWTWLPVILLSLLPHKEVRYLIPVLPFFSMLAAGALWEFVSWLTSPAVLLPRHRQEQIAALVLTAAVASLVWEAWGYPLPRTDGEVRIARHVAAQSAPEEAFAAPQSWRFGGPLYLGGTRKIISLDDALMAGDRVGLSNALRASEVGWVALPDAEVRRAECEEALRSGGFVEVSSPGTIPDSDFRLFRRVKRR